MKLIIKIFVFIVVLIPFNTCKGVTIKNKDIYAYSSYYSIDSSNVYLVLGVLFSTAGCELSYIDVNDSSDNEIILNACYRVGPLTTSCYRIDTFSRSV
jgi:hypothetical protein